MHLLGSPHPRGQAELSPSILLNRFPLFPHSSNLPCEILSALFPSLRFQMVHVSPKIGASSRIYQEISAANTPSTDFSLLLWSLMEISNVVFHVDLEGIGSSGCHLPLPNFLPAFVIPSLSLCPPFPDVQTDPISCTPFEFPKNPVIFQIILSFTFAPLFHHFPFPSSFPHPFS